MELVIACVGKPNVGKSSFLNVATDAKAKVGDFPFTTIEPNVGVSVFESKCACSRFGKEKDCKPRYGSCQNGTRKIQLKILDVAGLIPGASEGLGLGNKFLDDLRRAHVLIHVMDASGTTNEKGEKTSGYDPSTDAEWLVSEIQEWIFKNLYSRWASIARRHGLAKKKISVTLQAQLGGYGAKSHLVQEVIELMELKDPVDLTTWSEKDVRIFVSTFFDVRFKTVLVLNKIDKKESEKWIGKLLEKYGEDKVTRPIRDQSFLFCFVLFVCVCVFFFSVWFECSKFFFFFSVLTKDESPKTVLCSAASELFLKQLVKKGHIKYNPGDDDVITDEAGLKPMDEKQKQNVENIKDLILYRFGSTGVVNAINKVILERSICFILILC